MNYCRIFSVSTKYENYTEHKPRFAICVFGCDKIQKYKNQILKIKETWGKTALEYGVPVYFFLGEEPTDMIGYNINLPGVKDDYQSASYKQFYGLDYISKEVDPDFVLTCGTDTYLNIPRLLGLLDQYHPSDNLYIGGHGCVRNIGNKKIYFHSGGPGFILSRNSLERLCPFIPTIMDEWISFCNQHHQTDLLPACDVTIAYALSKPTINSKKIDVDGFYHCNHYGIPCHPNGFSFRDIYSCHNMSLSDFDEFTNILHTNNYFL